MIMMSFLSEKAYLLLHADGIDGGGSLGDDGGAAGAGVAGRGLGGKRNLAGLEGEGGHFFGCFCVLRQSGCC